jgi:FMN phosphatase YigB (HAD superfamily)
VPPAKRIAAFDNDGTLWPEQPNYIQFVFAFDRVKALVPEHPEWKTTQPFQAVLEEDAKAFAASGEKGLVEIITATHSGMTTDQFNAIVADWLANTKDRRFKRLYTELVYQPMLELLAYLRANASRPSSSRAPAKISSVSSPTRPIVSRRNRSWVRLPRRSFRFGTQVRSF